MLYDIFTVVLLLAGCLLLWLNLRPRQDVILTPVEPADLGISPHSGEYTAPGPFEADTRFNVPALEAFPSEERPGSQPADVEPGATLDQNSYASRVASALTKFRKSTEGP
jgi:hypothetical protein